jgi:Xaa-Pro aminopeptidase
MLSPATALASRHVRVRDALVSRELGAFVITHLPNVFYLTNLAASAAWAVVTPARLYLITDFRYSAAVDRLLASDHAPPATHLAQVEGSYAQALTRVLADIGPGRIGFEASHVTVAEHASWRRLLSAHPGRELVATDGIVEGLRVVKDDFELGLLREAAGRLSEVAREALQAVRALGRTEREVAAELDARIKRAGFDRTAFDTIAASGPNSALPHARPSDRTLEDGDLLLLDFGGVFHGYCVDLTRTVALGVVTTRQRTLFRAVQAAQQAALNAVAGGVTADVVDGAARAVLDSHGLAEAFGHSTGHGLGLEVHEDPRLGKRREDGPPPATLEPGMVCTVEPGAYLPGFGGVRIEDDVAVVAAGCERLTDVPLDERLL